MPQESPIFAPRVAKVKRPRPAFSCLTCRTRKVRCGREQPECVNCRRMNKKCEYQSASKDSCEYQNQRARQGQSHTGHSTVSRLDVVPGGHSIVRRIDDSHLGLTSFPEKAVTDPLPPHIDFLTIASVLKTIPDKHRCDGFVQRFLTSVYPLHPLINLPKFQSWYVDFWRWCDEAGDKQAAVIPGILLEDVTMNCVLFAVLYAGAAASALTSQESSITQDLKTTVSTALAACDHLNHPTLSTIAASLIIDPFMGKDLDSLEYGLSVGSVVRLAQSISLHRQRQDTMEEDKDTETQLRRRVWTHLTWLDAQHSLVTGLPLAMTVTAGGRLGSLPAPMARAESGDTVAGDTAILIHARSETASIQHRFLAVIQNASASTGIILEEIYQGFISEARTTRSAVDYVARNVIDSGVVRPWARKLMKLFYLQVAILIHAPFLRPPLRSISSSGPDIRVDPDQDQLWTRIIRLCIRYLRIYIAVTSDPAFAPHLWSFVRSAEPIQCAFLIISYLRHWPGSTGAYSGVCKGCVADVLAQWEMLQQRHGMQMMHGQKRLKVAYRAVERGQSQSPPGDVETETDRDIVTRNAGEEGDGGFELDIEFLDELFDWSGQEVHAARRRLSG